MKKRAVQVKDIANIQSGYAFKSSMFNNSRGLPIIRIRNVTSQSVDTFYDGDYSEEYIVNNGDLLVSMDGEFKIIKWKNGKGLLNQRVCRIHVKNKKITSKDYLLYFLPKKLKDIEDKTPFVTVKHLSVKDINNIELNLPPLETQKKIVEVLDKAQALIDVRKEQIKLMDELIKSVFYEMFGDPVTNSKKLPLVSLGKVCSLKAGKNIKASNISNDYEEGMYLCYGGNGLRGYVKEYTHEGSYPLIGRQGALCGNVQYAEGRFYATEHAIVTQPKVDMNTIWLYIMLREMNLNRLASGAAQPGLNVSTLVPLEVISPSVNFQNEFAYKVQQIETHKLLMEQSLTEIWNNYYSLIQKSFRGDLF